jgi:hypothetical protein
MKKLNWIFDEIENSIAPLKDLDVKDSVDLRLS